jgi:NAD(P)-dependent dehydrogenase (short-subunit alcohol dehydrogenase family)
MDPVLVTGSSTGLGLETALHLAERGFLVYATTRDLDSRSAIADQAARRGVTLRVLELDVTDPDGIEAAVDTIVAESGGVFGLVNNAGIGLRGCFEDLSEAEIRRVFEVNVFGTMAVTRRVLPLMRAAGRGRVVTVTSVGGRISTFGLSSYCATKFALEGFGEALDLELTPLGLRSILIEPGIIMTTRWTVNKGTSEHALDPESPYAEMFKRHEVLADGLARNSRTLPADVASAVHHALTARRPRMHYVVGRPASAAVALRRLLPDRLFEKLYFGSLLRRLAAAEAGGVAPTASVTSWSPKTSQST